MRTAFFTLFRDHLVSWLLNLVLMAAAVALAIWAEGKLSG